MVKLTVLAFSTFFAVFALPAFGETHSGIPNDVAFPPNITITPPDATIPSALAAYSGTWVGSLGAALNHVLVVEKVKPELVSVVYAWGNNPSKGVRADWQRGMATFEGTTLVYHSDGGKFTVKYIPQPDGSLAATYDNPGKGWRATAKMVKVLE